MDRQEFEQIFRAVDNGIYDFYRHSLYHMQEHPMIFWILLLMGLIGLGSVFGALL